MSLIHSQKGQALITVLIVMSVLTALAITLMNTFQSQPVWIRKYNKLNTILLAESAVNLQEYDINRQKKVTVENPFATDSNDSFADEEELEEANDYVNQFYRIKEEFPIVEVDSGSNIIQIHAEAVFRNNEFKLQTMYRKQLDSASFVPALRLSDTAAPSDINSADINGLIYLKAKKQPVGSNIRLNKNHEDVDSAFFKYAGTIYDQSQIRYNNAITLENQEDIELEFDSPPLILSGSQSIDEHDLHKYTDYEYIIIRTGDLDLEADDGETIFNMGKIKEIHVEGEVEINGMFDLSFVKIYAAGKVTIYPGSTGDNFFVFSKDRLEVKEDVEMNLSACVQGDIFVNENASLIRNSVLVNYGSITSASQSTGAIILRPHSKIHGFVISATTTRLGTGKNQFNVNGQLIMEPDSHIQGIAYSKDLMKVEGLVEGTVIARRLYCNTSFDNACIGPGKIDRSKMPKLYQPIAMNIGKSSKIARYFWKKL